MPLRHLRPALNNSEDKFTAQLKLICVRNFNIVTGLNFMVMSGYYLLFVLTPQYLSDTYQAALSSAGFAAGIMVIGCVAGRFVCGNLVSFIEIKKLLLLGIVSFIVLIALSFFNDFLSLVFPLRFLTGVAVGIIGTITVTIAARAIPQTSKGLGIGIFSTSTVLGLAFVLLGFFTSSFILLLSGFIFGLGYGNMQSIGQTVALAFVTPSRYPQATSTFYIFMDLGIGLGPYLFGLIIPYARYEGMFLILAAILFFTVPMYKFLHANCIKYCQNTAKSL